MVIKIVYTLLVGAYSILLLLSAIKELREKNTDSGNKLIFIGSILLFFSILPVWVVDFGAYFFVLLAGLVIIHTGALMNGYKLYGRPHFQHHIVRLVFTVVILAGFYSIAGV
ncbi:hypothetical protein [Anaerocolumna xylanovorans]|nr:hypothetical protein [Anaerocolumna xylanovorans]